MRTLDTPITIKAEQKTARANPGLFSLGPEPEADIALWTIQTGHEALLKIYP
jgi:hypothetical protein